MKSAVIRLDRRDDIVDDELLHATMTMADASFANRRKTISNSIKSYFSNSQTRDETILEAIPDLLARAGVDAKSRGESLDQGQFLELGRAYLSLKGK